MKALIEQKRITRLKEVRQQEKEAASLLREEVKKRRDKQTKRLKSYLEQEFEENKENHVQILQGELDRQLKQIGNAHDLKGKDDYGVKKELSEEVLCKTQQRYKKAYSKVLQDQAIKNAFEQKQNDLREKVHEIETERKEQMLAQPKQNVDAISKLKPIRVGGIGLTRGSVESFMSTRYHLGDSNFTAYPEVFVEKVCEEDQIDAIIAANEEKTRRTISKEKHDRQIEERKEKAEIRHLCAKKDVILKREKETLIEELKALELKDRNTKCETLRNIPKKVFQPPRQRYEEAKLKRMQLEHAFENIYNVKSDDIQEFQLPNFIEPEEDISEVSEVEHTKMVALDDDIAPVSMAISTHSESSSSSVSSSTEILKASSEPLMYTEVDRECIRRPVYSDKELYVITEDDNDVQTPSAMSSQMSSKIESPLDSKIESPLDSLISMNIESAAYTSSMYTHDDDETNASSSTCPPVPRSKVILIDDETERVSASNRSRGNGDKVGINDYVKTRLDNLRMQQPTNQNLLKQQSTNRNLWKQQSTNQNENQIHVKGYDNVSSHTVFIPHNGISSGSGIDSLVSEPVETKTDTSSILDEKSDVFKSRPILAQGTPTSMSPRIIVDVDIDEHSKVSSASSTMNSMPLQRSQLSSDKDVPVNDFNADHLSTNNLPVCLQNIGMKEKDAIATDASINKNLVDRSLSKTMLELKQVREKKEELRKYYASLIEKIQGCRGEVKEKGERLARRQANNKLSYINEERCDAIDFKLASTDIAEPESPMLLNSEKSPKLLNMEKSLIESTSMGEYIPKTDMLPTAQASCTGNATPTSYSSDVTCTPDTSHIQYIPQTLPTSIPLISTTIQDASTTTIQDASTKIQNGTACSIENNHRNLSDVYKSMFLSNSLLDLSHPEIDEHEDQEADSVKYTDINVVVQGIDSPTEVSSRIMLATVQSRDNLNAVSLDFNTRYLSSNVHESKLSTVLFDSNISSPHSDITIAESEPINDDHPLMQVKPGSPSQVFNVASDTHLSLHEDICENVNGGELFKSSSTHNSSNTWSLEEQMLSSAAGYPDSPSRGNIIEMKTKTKQIESSLPCLTDIQLPQLPRSSGFIPVHNNMKLLLDTNVPVIDSTRYFPLNEFMQTVPEVSRRSTEVSKGSSEVSEGSIEGICLHQQISVPTELDEEQQSPNEINFVNEMSVQSTQSDLHISILDNILHPALHISNLNNENQALVDISSNGDAYPSGLDILNIGDLSTSSLMSEDFLLAQMDIDSAASSNDIYPCTSHASPLSLPQSELLTEMFVELPREISPRHRESPVPTLPVMTSVTTVVPEAEPAMGIYSRLPCMQVQNEEPMYKATHIPTPSTLVETLSKLDDKSDVFPMSSASSRVLHKSTDSLSDSVRYMEQLDTINQLSLKYRSEQRKMLETYAKLKEGLLSDGSYVTASMSSDTLQVAPPSDMINKSHQGDPYSQDSSLGGHTEKQTECLSVNHNDSKKEKQLPSTEISDLSHNDLNKMSVESSSTESQAKKLFMSLFEGLSTPDMSIGNTERDDEKLSLFSLTDDSYRSLPLIKQFLASLSQSVSLVPSQSTGDEANVVQDGCRDADSELASLIGNKSPTEEQRNKLFLSFFRDISPEMSFPENSATGTENENFSMLSLTQNSYRNLPAIKNYLDSLQKTPSTTSQSTAKDVNNHTQETSLLVTQIVQSESEYVIISEPPLNVFSPSIYQSSSPTYISAHKPTVISKSPCVISSPTSVVSNDRSHMQNCTKHSHSASPVYIQSSMSSDGTMIELKNLKISSFSNDSVLESQRVSDLSSVGNSREAARKLETYKKPFKNDSDTSELFTVGRLKLSGTSFKKSKGVAKHTLDLLPPSGKTVKGKEEESSCSSSVDDVLKKYDRNLKRCPSSGLKQTKKQAKVSQKSKKQVKFK